MNDTVEFRVTDFSCPTCAQHVEHAIGTLDGIADVEVHFTTGRVEVEYDASRIAISDIEQVIERQGYAAQPA